MNSARLPANNIEAKEEFQRTIAVSGATGLVGNALARGLKTRGSNILRLTRRKTAVHDDIEWSPSGAPCG